MIEDLKEKISELEKDKKKFCNQARSSSKEVAEQSEMFLEGDLVNICNYDDFDSAEIIGLDGGIVKEELLGVDLVLTRAVAALFNFEKGTLSSSKYLPNRNPDPEPNSYEGLSRREFRTIASLLRVKKEVSLALEAVKKEPDIVLMDGSIVLHHRDRPSKDSPLYEQYEEILDIFEELYREAEDREVLLAGVVEDSREGKVCEELESLNLMEKEFNYLLSKSRDLEIMNKVLEKGERSSIMKYSAREEKHPILKDIEYSPEIYTFYLKTVSEDLPVKIDFLSSEEPSSTAENIAELICPISSFNNHYGIPSVIIEADQRAKLGEKHIKSLKRDLRSEIGDINFLKDLRRNRRPF